MSTTINQAFITQFEDEVHQAYQQTQAKLRNTVRLKTNVKGSTCRFPVYGKGLAQQKTRHGDIPLMNNAHTYVDAAVADWYASDLIDDLDELKTNIDERNAATTSGAAALGRKTDSLIIAAASAGLPAGQKVLVGTSGLTKAKIHEAMEKLNANDVPDDGNRVGVVGVHQWSELLNIDEFASSDFIGTADLPWVRGTQAKMWLNTLWIMSTLLTLSSTTRYCLLYHKMALGLAENQSIKSTIERVPLKDSYIASSKLSAGAIRIDDTGVVEIAVDDTAAIS